LNAAYSYYIVLEHQYDALEHLYTRVQSLWHKRLTLRKRLDALWRVRPRTFETGRKSWLSLTTTEDSILSCNFELQVLGDAFVAALARDLDELKAGTGLDIRTMGYDILPSLRLGAAIWALGNKIRHSHSWTAEPSRYDKSTRSIIDQLPGGHDADSSAQFITLLNLAFGPLHEALTEMAVEAQTRIEGGEVSTYIPPVCGRDSRDGVAPGNVLFEYRESRSVNHRGLTQE
jgi:hypothetical protein